MVLDPQDQRAVRDAVLDLAGATLVVSWPGRVLLASGEQRVSVSHFQGDEGSVLGDVWSRIDPGYAPDGPTARFLLGGQLVDHALRYTVPAAEAAHVVLQALQRGLWQDALWEKQP